MTVHTFDINDPRCPKCNDVIKLDVNGHDGLAAPVLSNGKQVLRLPFSCVKCQTKFWLDVEPIQLLWPKSVKNFVTRIENQP